MKQFAIFKVKTSVEKVLTVEKEIRTIDSALAVEHTSKPAQVWATAPEYWPDSDIRIATAKKIMSRHFGSSEAAAALGSIKSEKKSASSRENGKLGGRPKGIPAIQCKRGDEPWRYISSSYIFDDDDQAKSELKKLRSEAKEAGYDIKYRIVRGSIVPV